MAQPQRQADVHQEELCPPNKCYALMDANKKIDLDDSLYPNESKIMANIIHNHPLRFSIAASSSVPWIYLRQFWHTLQEDGSKYRLKFVLDRKEITITLNDFRRIFHLPQATDNNHERFVAALKFSEMVPFFLNTLGFTLELRSPSKFKTKGPVQPWQTLGKIFARCLTTRVTSHDQPPLQIMQMLYCFVNNIHVDYAELLWKGLRYALEHPSTQILYPRFTKLIVGYYMTAFHEISRRARDTYHNLEDDTMFKNIFNSGKHKDGVGMKIPSWMITDEMKLTDHYRMYAAVFGVDVPMTQSQPIESTQGTHRTTSTPRTPNSNVDEAGSNKIQLSLAKQKSRDVLEAKQNVQKVEEHLIAEEIEKLVEEAENVEESLEVEITAAAQPVNVNEEEEESAEDDYELKRREKGKHVEEFETYVKSKDLDLWHAITDGDFPPIQNNPESKKDEVNYPQDDAHSKGENDAKRQKTSEHGTYMSVESSSRQNNKSEPDDDEIPTEKVLQELVDEMSHTVNEAKLRKVVDEMLRQRCTLRDERQYHIDQMQNFLKNDILSFLMMILKTELQDRRANGSIVSITESDYKNLNKNDIEDMYLRIVNNKVDDYVETGLLWSLSVFIRRTVIWERVHDFQLGVESNQQKVNFTTLTITFPGIENYKVFSIVSEPVYGIIYKNKKKEKRVMRHQEVHKFCDATLKRVLERLKSYNNDVKHGYVILSLSNEDAEYLQLFEEEIEEWFKHRDQMRR
ncbi:hypothetical protein Tco_0064818 [Tanacetum coccineum]